jgi:hypothetical protein
MNYFSDQVIASAALAGASASAIGERTRHLEGAPDGVPVSLLSVQHGPILDGSGGAASRAAGQPLVEVLAVADAIICGARTVAEERAFAQ